MEKNNDEVRKLLAKTVNENPDGLVVVAVKFTPQGPQFGIGVATIPIELLPNCAFILNMSIQDEYKELFKSESEKKDNK